MTREQIRNMIRKALGETVESYWTNVEINQYINVAAKDISEKTRCIRTHDQLTITAGEEEYNLLTSLDDDLVDVVDVYHYSNATTWTKLKATSRELLDIEHPGWKSASNGVPILYAYERESDSFIIYPPPDSTNAGTDYVDIYYAETFTDLDTSTTDDSTTPAGLNTLLQLAVIDWVVALGQGQRGLHDQSGTTWTRFNQKITEYYAVRKLEKYDDEDLVTRPSRR